MKILHVELGATLVGGPQQVIYIVDGLNRIGCDNVVACEPGTPLARHLGGAGIPLRGIHFQNDLDVGYVLRLKSLIEDEAPDLVHIHSRRGAHLSALAARLAAVPTVASRRVDDRPRGLLSSWFFGRLNQKVICISQAIHDVMVDVGLPQDRLVMIRSAVDAEAWHSPAPRSAFLAEFGLPENAVTIGVVAQLIVRKGHRYLFEAVADCLPENARLVVFGEGRDRAMVEEAIVANGLAGRVVMAGHRYDMPRWMGNLDLLVHPALAEGLGVALLQASSAGVPVIASAVGGIGEAVRDGVNGVLVPPGDVVALRAAILRLLEDQDLRRWMGEQGRHLMETEFGCDRMVENHRTLYEQLLAA